MNFLFYPFSFLIYNKCTLVVLYFPFHDKYVVKLNKSLVRRKGIFEKIVNVILHFVNNRQIKVFQNI